ncbi:MAG: glycosyltransferase family 2 protein [Flavobacteriales bacterium]|nr:glycosyltransferase family 2 protein [Flavobacteriales bacterium]
MIVSCVIPCHNVEAFVEQAVASALAQEVPGGMEVIAVDDGSTDGTPALLDALAARSGGRVRVVHQPNRGASAARNVGLSLGTGEFVQFLDADDLLLPGKVQGQLALAKDGGTDLVVGDYEQVMPNGLLLRVRALAGKPWMALIRTRMGTTSSVLWRRSALVRINGWNEELASSQDYELMFRALQGGCAIAWDDRVLTQVLKRATGSISQTEPIENWKRYIQLRRAMKEHLERTDAKGFADEIEALRQYIFMALRIVAVSDMRWASAMYRSCIGRGFHPEVSKAITERYVFLHNLLGFDGAERATRLLKRTR